MTDQLSLLPMLDDAEHPTWLLNGKPGRGPQTDNVFEARERPNLMDAVNGNATVNMSASKDVTLESANIHEETF